MTKAMNSEFLKALKLPPKQRALLARKLLESLDEVQVSYEALWLNDAEQRYHSIIDGQTQTKPAGEVMRAAHDRISN